MRMQLMCFDINGSLCSKDDQAYSREENNEGEDSKDGRYAQYLLGREDKYVATFSPQYPTPERHVIQSATHHAPWIGGSSHQEYGLGKGKAPMETRQAPHWDDDEDD
ncbi:hypothetical protein J1N35_025647 [Gossypium stocksii]|uniref:Uncharacterized protein n=1 Tax=Gossypium stocksii TaxID=47602 RepID=A0A9D3V6X0_9ROSI|nr:hypothetical protein J1N35_025647 [Gossypium stocksii]